MIRKNKVKLVLSVVTLLVLLRYYCMPHNVLNTQILDNLPKFGSMTTLGAFPIKSPLVRLGVYSEKYKTINTFCSGSVIDDNYVLTAAHCLTKSNGEMETNEIVIQDSTEDSTEPVMIKSKAAAINSQLDYGLVLGDYSQFQKLHARLTAPVQFENISKIFSCGFPGGQKEVVCTPVPSLHTKLFSYVSEGTLIPGMSGGPVITVNVLGETEIIAVNSGVDDDLFQYSFMNTVFSPILGLLGEFNLE